MNFKISLFFEEKKLQAKQNTHWIEVIQSLHIDIRKWSRILTSEKKKKKCKL